MERRPNFYKHSITAAYYIGNKAFRLSPTDPVPPKPDEVRVEIAYTGICGTDLHIYHGAMDQRVCPPRVIGHEASAVVAEAGSQVTGFTPGDRVVIRPLDHRGERPSDRGYRHICRNLKFIGIDSPGAFQRSLTLPAFTLHHVPNGVDLAIAALAEPLAVACHDVRRARLTSGERTVVMGAGPIGLLIALVARQAGAEVLITDINPHRLAFARKLGFCACNPQETDLPAYYDKQSGGAGADVVFEVSGAAASVALAPELLGLRGRMVQVAIFPKPVELNLFAFFWKELELIGARVYEPEDYEHALALMAAQALPLDTFISATFPLREIGTAFQQLDQQSNAIKVLIDCQA